jgi:hypothetical protein
MHDVVIGVVVLLIFLVPSIIAFREDDSRGEGAGISASTTRSQETPPEKKRR